MTAIEESKKIVKEMLKFVEADRKFYTYEERWKRVERLEYLMGMNIKLWQLFFEIKEDKEK